MPYPHLEPQRLKPSEVYFSISPQDCFRAAGSSLLHFPHSGTQADPVVTTSVAEGKECSFKKWHITLLLTCYWLKKSQGRKVQFYHVPKSKMKCIWWECLTTTTVECTLSPGFYWANVVLEFAPWSKFTLNHLYLLKGSLAGLSASSALAWVSQFRRDRTHP